MLLFAFLVSAVYSATTSSEINAIRDDLLHVCYKIYGTGSAATGANKHCRFVAEGGDPQIHVTYECRRSGWSGAGAFKCKYGADVYTRNVQNPGYTATFKGYVGRRRIEAVEEDMFESDEEDMLAVEEDEEDMFKAQDEEVTEQSMWEGKTHPVYFELENIEDDTEVMSLGNVAICMLQGFEYIQPEDKSVGPHCKPRRNGDGVWELSYASAKCSVVCYPHGAARMF